MEECSKISVIVPVYNMERYLEQCIQSICGQTYQNLEIILVEDGSTDGSPSLCDYHAAIDGRIVVLHKENEGLMAAWMDGVKISTGEYVCFVDSDDWVDSTMIEDMAACLTGQKKEAVCSNYVIEKPGKTVPVKQSLEPGIYERSDIEKKIVPDILGQEQRRITFSRCMKLFSRQLFLDNMHYCNKAIHFGEDVNIVLPALLDAERIVIMEEGFYYHYRFVGSSMVHAYNPKLIDNICLLYQTITQIAIDKQIPKAEEVCKKELLYLMFYGMKNELRGEQSQYRTAIKQIAEMPALQEAMELAAGQVQVPLNRLLYRAMKYPGGITTRLLRLLFRLF